MSTAIRVRSVLVSLCWITSLCLPAFAESEQKSQDLATPDRRVVVTATRIEQSPDRVGSSITVITQEDIRRHQDRMAIDVLNRVPGVTVRRDGSRPGARASIFMRGTDSDHTLVLINGVKIHDPSAPNREPFLEHMPVEDIERIEVLRGPQSTLYGSEAIGGVINIITKRGGDTFSAAASFEGGSHATFTETVSLRGRAGPIDFSVSGTRIDSGGISAKEGDPERDGYRDSSLSVRLGAAPNETFGVDVYFQYLASEVEIDAGADPRTSDTESEQIFLSAEPRLSLFDGFWEQKLRYWLNDSDRDNDGDGFALPSDFRSFSYGVDWQHEIAPFPFLTVVAGFEFEAERATFEPSFAPKFRARTHSIAYYQDNQFSFWDRLFLTAGFRVDDHEDFGTEATYRFTGALQIPEIPGAPLTLRASIGTGFKAPSLAQLFDASFGSNNPDLQPEESLGLDFGFELELFDDLLVYRATYFYNDIDNMIVGVAPFPFQNVNIEAVETQGLETSLSVRLDPFTFEASYTYTDTEAKEGVTFGLTKGERLLRRPEHQLSADLSGRFLDERLELMLSLLYVGERKDLDPITFATVTASDYTVVDLKGSYRMGERLEVFARVENLLDEDYQDVLGFGTPGLSGFAGIRVRLP